MANIMYGMFNVAKTALNTQQKALNVTANNIANVMGVFVPANPFTSVDIGYFGSFTAVQQLFLLGAIAILRELGGDTAGRIEAMHRRWEALRAPDGDLTQALDEGNGARQVLQAPGAPIRTVVIGIVDEVTSDS